VSPPVHCGVCYVEVHFIISNCAFVGVNIVES
jgi:hypothetical protein